MNAAEFRAAVERDRVVFRRGAVERIVLDEPLRVPSGCLIDGSGADVTITGHGLIIDNAHDVLLRRVRFTAVEGDAVQITRSRTVRIDHCAFDRCVVDGALDATRGSTDVTVSWCLFRQCAKTMLLGAGSDGGAPPLVDMTVHHCWFDRCGERTPFARHGRFHVYNCLFDRFGYGPSSGSAVKAGCGALMFIEANAWLPAGNRRAVAIADSRCDRSRPPGTRLVANWAPGMRLPPSTRPESVPLRGAHVDKAGVTLVDMVRAGAGHLGR